MSSDSITETLFEQTMYLSSNFTDVSLLQNCVIIELLSPFVLHSFNSVELTHLRECYQHFIHDLDVLEIPQVFHKHKKAMWWSQHLKSSKYPKKMASCILSNWIGEDGCINEPATAGRIEFFSVRDYYSKVGIKHNSKYELLKPAESGMMTYSSHLVQCHTFQLKKYKNFVLLADYPSTIKL